MKKEFNNTYYQHNESTKNIERNSLKMLEDIEIDLEELDRDGFSDLETKKLKKNFKKTINKRDQYRPYKKLAVAASVLLISASVFGTGFGDKVWANIVIATKDMASIMGVNNDLDSYSKVVNKEITKNGVTVKLNEVILDEDEIIVSTSYTSGQKFEQFSNGSADVYINGKLASDGATGAGERIDDYTEQYVLSNTLTDNIDMNKDLNIKLVYSDMNIDDKNVRGKWVFEFSANGKELAKNTTQMSLSQKININGPFSITLDKYKRNDIGDKIYFSYNNKVREGYDIFLSGEDNLGNKVDYYLSNGRDNGGYFKNQNIDSTIDYDATELTLSAYAVKMPEASGKMPDQSEYKKLGEPFKIDLTKLKHID